MTHLADTPVRRPRYFPFDSDGAADFLARVRRAHDPSKEISKALANVPREVASLPRIAPAQWEEAIAAAELLAARALPPSPFALPPDLALDRLPADEETLARAREVVMRLIEHAPLPEYTNREVWDVHEAGWNDLLVRLGGRAMPRRAMPDMRRKWALSSLAAGRIHEDLLECVPPAKHASEQDESTLLSILQAMERARLAGATPELAAELSDASRARLEALTQCGDGLRCILAYHDDEDPNVFLDATLHPLAWLVVAMPFVGRGLEPRTYARAALEVGSMLGGDAALGVLAMMLGEDSYADYHVPVYGLALAALSSWLPWAVRVIEEAACAADFAPQSTAESSPALAAARFEVRRRRMWPGAVSAWSSFHLMDAAARGTKKAWRETRARVDALSDAIEQAEAGPSQAGATVSPGQLVLIPNKGVTVVLETLDDADVVATYTRPQSPRVAYPKGVLGPLAIEAPPFFGAPSADVEASAARRFNAAVRALRVSPQKNPPASHATIQRLLNDYSGLEMHARFSPIGASSWSLIHTARSIFRDVVHHITAPCDDLLAAAAWAQVPRLLDLALAPRSATSEGGRQNLLQALEIRALDGWLRGSEATEAVTEFEALVLAREPESASDAVSHAIALASFGRWSAVQALSKRGQALAETQAASEDYSDSARGERYLRAWKILLAFADRQADPAGARELLSVPATREAIRSELDLEASWAISLAHLRWLRILHWRGGTSGLTPREVILTSYFELSATPWNGERRPRKCPPSMEAEIQALGERIGVEREPSPEA